MIINRLSKLISADVNALLDTVEDPELTVRQAIRDMEQLIHDNEQQLALIERRVAARTTQATALNKQITAFDEQLDLCFAEDDNDLARHVVGKKLAATRRIDDLAIHSEHDQRERDLLSSDLAEQRDTLADIRAKAETVVGRSTEDASGTANVSANDIELALLAERSKRERRS